MPPTLRKGRLWTHNGPGDFTAGYNWLASAGKMCLSGEKPAPPDLLGALCNWVPDWLERVGMCGYAQCFAENNIYFTLLGDLTDQNLKELRVGSGSLPQAAASNCYVGQWRG
jgi:SAM domain (Sterile alpha motif)